MICCEVQKMLAIGKEAGPALRTMEILVESCEPFSIDLMRMNDPQGVAIIRREDDGVVGAPSAAARIWRVGYRRDGTAGYGDGLQFSFGKESDG